MMSDENHRTHSKITLPDLEQSIMELRDAIAVLMAFGHFSIGDARVLWIAGKLEEAVERLLGNWQLLVIAARIETTRDGPNTL